MPETLQHWGVKGMRWGVRRNLRKLNRQQKKADTFKGISDHSNRYVKKHENSKNPFIKAERSHRKFVSKYYGNKYEKSKAIVNDLLKDFKNRGIELDSYKSYAVRLAPTFWGTTMASITPSKKYKISNK